MRRAANRLGLILILVGCVWVYGCASGDLLDELNQRYTFNLTIEDADEETLDIDVIQNGDCDADGVADDPETFTNVFGTIAVTISANTLGLRLDRYTVEYIPNPSPDGTGATVTPPALQPLSRQFNSFYVAPKTTGSDTVIIMTIDTKQEYVNDVLADPALANLDVGLYSIRVTLHCTDEELQEKTFTLYRDVTLANYDNC